MTWRALPGALLCTLLLAATVPALVAALDFPGRVLLGEGVYAVTQGSGPSSLNDTLVARLEAARGTEVVSPEVLAFSLLRGEPVIVRGAAPGPFLALEGGATDATLGPDAEALVGDGLATRLGLGTGDRLLLAGSIAPKFLELGVDGTFTAPTPARDEILTHPDAARDLAGIGPGAYHQVRVRTADPEALLAALRDAGASIHVFTPARQVLDVNSEPPRDDRIANLILRGGQGTVAPDRLSGAVSQVANSVRVVVLGLLAAIVALVAVGVHSVHARVMMDKLPNVRILRSLGAGRAWIVRQGLREALPLAFAGAIAGVAAGTGVALLAGSLDLLVVFGHSVRPELSIPGLVAIALVPVALSLASTVLFLASHSGARPGELGREGPGPQPALEEVLA